MSEHDLSPPAKPRSAMRLAGPSTRGMLTLRADLSAGPVVAAIENVVAAGCPGRCEARLGDARDVLWMSPDELMILCAPGTAPTLLGELGAALEGTHHLLADMSDARALFGLHGPRCRETLAKLGPADLSPRALGPGEVRRTRLGQVPAAFWFRAEDHVEVMCFASVRGYMHDLLSAAIAPGGEITHFAVGA